MKYLIIFLISFSLISCSGGGSKKYSGEHLKLLWTIKKDGWIPSSVLIKDNSVYYGSFDNSIYKAELLNGKIRIAFKTGNAPYYKPIINKEKIFFTSFDLNIYCIDTTGRVIWKEKTKGRIKNELVEDENMIIASIRGDGLRKLDKATGKTIWHLQQSSSSPMTNQPLIYGDNIYVGNYDDSEIGGRSNKIISVNKYTGAVKWQQNYFDFEHSDPVLTSSGLLVGMNKYYKGGVVKLLDYYTGEVLWSADVDCDTHIKPTINGLNALIADYNGEIVCLDLRNGRAKWRLRLEKENRENALGELVSHKGKLYFSTSQGNLYCLDIKTGKIIFKEDFFATDIIVYENRLYLRGSGGLWILKE